MNYEFDCDFSVPVNIGTTSRPDYEYSLMECLGTSTDPTSTIALIENASTGASFYIRKEISYGEVLMIVFLILFLIFGILKFLTDFLIPKIFNWKRR